MKQFIYNPSGSYVDVQNIHSPRPIKKQNNLIKTIERNSPGKSMSMCTSKYRYRPMKHHYFVSTQQSPKFQSIIEGDTSTESLPTYQQVAGYP